MTLFRALRSPLLATLLIGLSLPATAQHAHKPKPSAAPIAVEPDRSAWLYRGSDLTPDPEWHFGTLPNGLRYAVRRNAVPPGQVSVRVRIDAGSLDEEDSQQGYAHLIEHLTFRGSEYVPDGEAKRVWQRLGVTFGSDSNAQTTPTETVYKLDLPSATEDGLDESLKILAGMMQHPAIVQSALDAERPVVLAEQREQPGPQVRFGDLQRRVLFAGQRLADRSPIGSIKTLEAATPTTVSAFHDRWYRPERTVVVLSGDFEPAVLEKLVIAHFADWKGIEPSPADTDFGKPDPNAPSSGSIVEPGLPPAVTLAVLRPWKFNADTAIFNQKRLVDVLATLVINRRLETRARTGGSFVQASTNLDDIARSANAKLVSIVPVGSNWQAALKDVRAVIADAMAAPPSQAEVDRELSEYAIAMKTQVDTAAVEAGGKQADDMVGALDIRETVISAQASYGVLLDAKAKNMFTADAVFASTKRIFQGDAMRAVVSTPTADANVTAELAAALAADVTGLAGKRTAGRTVTFDSLPKLGPPATIVSRETIYGMEKVIFSNGARLLVSPSNSEPNRVYVVVRFGKGINALPANHETPAWAGDLALIPSGIGTLGQDEIDQLTAGRRLGLDFAIGEDAFALGALTSPEDMGDELRLIAAKIGAPAWDPNPVMRARAVMLASFDGQTASPDGVLSRDLERLLHDSDPRWGSPSRAAVTAMTPKSFRAFWEPLLKTGPIEVQVFGDIKTEDVIAAAAKSIGALPPRKASTAVPPPVRFPAHVVQPVMRTHDGQDNQAAAIIAWPTGAGIEAISESRKLDVLAQIFQDRMFEKLRSAAGASYSPSVDSSWPTALPGGGRIMAMGQVAPDHVDFFFHMARDIAADLVANPVSGDELQRTIAPMRQALARASTVNQFWMRQFAGGTYNPLRFEAVRGLFTDLQALDPAQIQDVAKKYLRPDADWTMAVVPKAPATPSSPR
ncbi:insulinase family protein [soil metagenome]